MDEPPFHAHYYKKDRDPDVCGDIELPLYYNPDQTCADCHCIYSKDQDWLKLQTNQEQIAKKMDISAPHRHTFLWPYTDQGHISTIMAIH